MPKRCANNEGTQGHKWEDNQKVLERISGAYQFEENQPNIEYACDHPVNTPDQGHKEYLSKVFYVPSPNAVIDKSTVAIKSERISPY